eukprot:TRINITY_DN623_c0_g1_i4.p1 TRINITY_DN623_c0_g1~~TRINITY_DN623_c0_g1_i4.p1  ORF type:complete len:192 (+),score=19.88 TRINITY_DN623_c0_g1_i4:376-951(+)
MVFASRPACRRCGAQKPTPAGYGYGNPYERPPMSYGAGYAGGYYPTGYSGYGLTTSMAAPPSSVNQRPGDWMCTCGELVFASREACRRCGTTKTSLGLPSSSGVNGAGGMITGAGYGGQTPTMQPGDWMCSCGELVFGSRPACRRCGTAKPPSAGGGYPQMRPGDWICKDCGDLQFASRTACRRCGLPKTE